MVDVGLKARTCPRCNVAVAPGYVRCPRCHAELPATRSRSSSFGTGTAVDAVPSRTPLYAAIAGGVVAVGLIVWFVTRDGDAAPVSTPSIEEAAAEEAAPGPGAAAPTPTPTATPESGPSRASALGELARAFNADRVFATVSAEGDTVALASSMCDEASLSSVLGGASAALRAAGFRAVRCKALHGAVIFERGL